MTPEASAEAVAFLDHARLFHRSSGTWSLFSGGDDSLATAIVTSQALGFRGCLHIDTGIGIPETQQFVVETCERQGWPLKIYRAKDWHDRLILSTGIRRKESQRRMGYTERTRQEGVKVWVNPIYEWSKADCLAIIDAAGVPRNPVVELLHMSGECLCGSFAKPNELKEIALWYPRVAERIRALEADVKAAGHDGVWGVAPKPKRKRQPAKRDSAGRKRVGMLCQQCELHFAEA